MKKLLIALMFVCGGASANEMCDANGSFAETVMKVKLDGSSFESSKIALNRVMKKDDVLYDSFLSIIDWAYVKQQTGNNEKDIKNFGSEVRETCEKVYKEQGWKH